MKDPTAVFYSKSTGKIVGFLHGIGKTDAEKEENARAMAKLCGSEKTATVMPYSDFLNGYSPV